MNIGPLFGKPSFSNVSGFGGCHDPLNVARVCLALLFIPSLALGQGTNTCAVFACISIEKPRQPGNGTGNSNGSSGSSGGWRPAPTEYDNVHRGRFWNRRTLEPDDGYEWASNDPHNFSVRLVADGTPSKRHRHTIWDRNGHLHPEDGYEWVTNAPGNFEVRHAKAGTPSTRYPNVLWAENGGMTSACFTGFPTTSNFRVESDAGTPYPGLSNVIHTEPGDDGSRAGLSVGLRRSRGGKETTELCCVPEYSRTLRDSCALSPATDGFPIIQRQQGIHRVQFVPGIPFPGLPNVVLVKPGRVKPAPGYHSLSQNPARS